MTELSKERKKEFLPRKRRLVMGVDLGQIKDPTAICVIEYCDGVNDEGSPWERHTNQTTALGLQKKAERWRCVHMERIPLNTMYGDVVQHLAALLATPQLQRDPDKNQTAAELVVDAGGPAPGVIEMLRAAGLHPIQIIITGGIESNAKRGRFTVGSHELITTLDARLHHDRYPLAFSKHLAEGEAFKAEIADFRRNVTAAGRMQFGARVGRHDDMVFSIALAVWWLSRPGNRPMQQGIYGSGGPVRWLDPETGEYK